MDLHLTDDEANKLTQSEGGLRKIAEAWLAFARNLCDQLADMPSITPEEINAIRTIQSRIHALRFAAQSLLDVVEQNGGNK
jgi:hypothetical protein